MINPWDVVPGQDDSGRIRSSDLSELLLAHIARYWQLGSASLRKKLLLSVLRRQGIDSPLHPAGLIAVLKVDGNEPNHTPTSEERLMMKHFSVLDPNSPTRRRSISLSARNSQPSPNAALISPAAHDLPSPNFSASGGRSDGLWWPHTNNWDHFLEFEVDQQPQSSIVKFSSNIMPLDTSRQDITLCTGRFQDEPPIAATSHEGVIPSFH